MKRKKRQMEKLNGRDAIHPDPDSPDHGVCNLGIMVLEINMHFSLDVNLEPGDLGELRRYGRIVGSKINLCS